MPQAFAQAACPCSGYLWVSDLLVPGRGSVNTRNTRICREFLVSLFVPN